MKGKHFWILLLLILAKPVSGQLTHYDLVIMEPLPTINFGSIAINNNLEGQPKIFIVEMLPHGTDVYLEGNLEWRKIGGDRQFHFIYSFKTAPFLSHNVYNDELGNTIQIVDDQTDDDLINENLDKGKPTGTYRLTIAAYDVRGNLLGTDTELLEFLNPAQTLEILLPLEGSMQDAGNVVAQWNPVVGATDYTVRANVRKFPSQSLEEALNSGLPLIDNKNVGNVTSANLRELLDREWLPGQEIVLQVSANIGGPDGGYEYFSNVVNFTINDLSPGSTQELLEALRSLLQQHPDLLDEDTVKDILKGSIPIESILSETGASFSVEQAVTLVRTLSSNPELVIGIGFE